MKKKVIIISIIILIILIILFSLLIYPVITNNHYEERLINNIYNNTKYKNIDYINKDNNYYILKAKNKVIVLDLNYEEKLSLDTNKLAKNNLELVYRRNNLYYEEKIKEDKKIIYNFYDVETNELKYTRTLGGI